MRCVACKKEANVKRKNYLCYHCGEISCFECGEKVFKCCPTCGKLASKRPPIKTLLQLVEKNPLHPNRGWIYYSMADRIDKNNKMLFSLYLKAAKCGIPGAMDYVGYSYYRGFKECGGVNYQQALFWLTMAAENNLKVSFYDLAKIYELGLGVPKDPYRATTIYIAGGALGNHKCRKEAEKRLVNRQGFDF